MIVIDRYTTEYSYNGIGRNATLTTWQDADTPQITAWSCNHRGQMTAETNADNHPVTCSYDGDGQQLPHPWARQVNGAPLITTCSYDAAGRQTGYSDGVPPAVILTLNFLDRQTSVTDAAGTRNFTYDAAHRLANEKNPLIVNGLLSHTYAPTVRTATIGNGTDTRTDAYMPETWDIASSSRQTADPLGYPDGWNNFAYVNNGVTMAIDWLGTITIFVGGASEHILTKTMSEFMENTCPRCGQLIGGGSNLYAWTDKNEIIEFINTLDPDEPLRIVGHSYGGDTAYLVARDCGRNVEALVTFDAVSNLTFNISPPSDVDNWYNIYVTGGNYDTGDLIADLGGHWQDIDGATNIEVPDVQHGDVAGMMNYISENGYSNVWGILHVCE